MGHPATKQHHTSEPPRTPALKNPKTTDTKSNLELITEESVEEHISNSGVLYQPDDKPQLKDELAPHIINDIHPTREHYIIEDFEELLTKTKPDYWVHDVLLPRDVTNPQTQQDLVRYENVIGGFHNDCLHPGFVVDSIDKDFAQHFVYSPKTTLNKLTETVNPQTYISQKLAHGIITHVFSQKNHRRRLYPTFKEYANKAIWEEQNWRERINELVPGDQSIAQKVFSGQLAEAIGITDEITDKMRFSKYSSEVVTPVDGKPRLTIHDHGIYQNHTLYGVNRKDT